MSMQNQNTPQNHMRFNPNYNQNHNFNNHPVHNHHVQNIPPMQPIQPIAPVAIVPQHPFSMYLQEVTEFCQHLNSKEIDLLPKYLSIKQAIEIVMVADRLHIDRIQALKQWKVVDGQVLISANFLARLFYRRNMLNQELSSLDNKPVDELTLMSQLRKSFPELLMGIICLEEVPPSKTTVFISTLGKLSFIGELFKTDNPLLTIFIMAALILGTWFQVTSTIYWAFSFVLTAVFCISAYKGKKMHITDDYLRIIKSLSSYCAKKLHTFIGSCITSDKNDTSESFPNITQQSVPKTTKLSKSEDEDMYLDLDEMEVKSQKSKNTTSLN